MYRRPITIAEHAIDEAYKLGERRGAQLVHHAAAMNLDRLLGGADVHRDVLVRQAARDECADLRLARREPRRETPQADARAMRVLLLLAGGECLLDGRQQ